MVLEAVMGLEWWVPKLGGTILRVPIIRTIVS